MIVKLALMELSSGVRDGRYDGGDWHVEGTLNERIVASAFVYLDATPNLSESRLTLRFSTLQFDRNQVSNCDQSIPCRNFAPVRSRGRIQQPAAAEYSAHSRGSQSPSRTSVHTECSSFARSSNRRLLPT